LSFLQDQGLGGSSLVVASFGDGLMDAAPEGPLQDVIEAKADGQLEPSDEPADLRHTESNWKKFVRSGAPFSALTLTHITARKASASIDKVMCRYQPCQLRTS
jgi:hypothetical protein